MIYLDNAATSYPKPRAVKKAMLRALDQYAANPGRSGHDMSIATAREVFKCRERAANFFGLVDPAGVVFTQNCTHALNLLLYGLLKKGDHVIISDMEHNSVLRPIHTLAEQGMIEYDIARVSPHDDEKTVMAFAAKRRFNTRLILCSHASNVFGIVAPIAKLAQLAHAHGILFAVDAAQSAGVLKIDMQRDGIDFLCMPGHKGLYGPAGTGMLLTSKGELLRPLMQGGTGTSSMNYTQPEELPEKLESGTINTVGILGLKAGLQVVAAKGIDSIYSHELSLARALYRGLSRMENVFLYTQEPEEGRAVPIISFNLRGQNCETVAKLLNEKHIAVRSGLHCSPLAHLKFGTADIGTVRVSLGMHNRPEEVEYFLMTVRKLIANR